jgi:hypothetical protein
MKFQWWNSVWWWKRFWSFSSKFHWKLSTLSFYNAFHFILHHWVSILCLLKKLSSEPCLHLFLLGAYRSEPTFKTKTQCDKYIRSGLLVYNVIFIGGPNRLGAGSTWAGTTWAEMTWGQNDYIMKAINWEMINWKLQSKQSTLLFTFFNGDR